MRVDFPTGHWIDIVPIQNMKAKHKDAYEGGPKFYLKFDDQGKPDLSGLPMSMTIAKLQRNALMASLISDWTFTDDYENKLPVPTWDGAEIHQMESIGEIPIDDILFLEDLLAPYIAKAQRKPDPKTTTTGSSTGLSKGKEDSPTDSPTPT